MTNKENPPMGWTMSGGLNEQRVGPSLFRELDTPPGASLERNQILGERKSSRLWKVSYSMPKILVSSEVIVEPPNNSKESEAGINLASK